jgi:hypothetical protein
MANTVKGEDWCQADISEDSNEHPSSVEAGHFFN